MGDAVGIKGGLGRLPSESSGARASGTTSCVHNLGEVFWYEILVPDGSFSMSLIQIPLDGPDQTLSETRVYDLVSDKVRSGPLGSPTSSRTLSGRRHF